MTNKNGKSGLRRIYIGDIQGCYEELERLLEKLGYDPSADALHPVGDLINRGPDSLACLRFLRREGARAVLGNHDIHLLRVAAGLQKLRGRDTLTEVLEAPDREKLLKWLAALPFIRRSGDVLQVHAGLDPTWSKPTRLLADCDPLESDPDSDFAVLVRYCDEEGRRPERDDPPPGAPFKPWYEFRSERGLARRTVVFGHWAQKGLVELPGLRGLDTGCVWGGRLTAWVAEEDRLVSVAARRTYCNF